MIAGLGLLRVQFAHLAHELLLGFADIEQRLAGLGVAEEDHEVDRVALAQRDADLRVVLEAADARAVAGARVDDHVGTALRIDGHAFRRRDLQQRVVDGARQLAPVHHGLVVEVQQRRLAFSDVLQVVVAALAHRVEEEHRALRGVDRVRDPVGPARGSRTAGPASRARRRSLRTPSSVHRSGCAAPPRRACGRPAKPSWRCPGCVPVGGRCPSLAPRLNSVRSAQRGSERGHQAGPGDGDSDSGPKWRTRSDRRTRHAAPHTERSLIQSGQRDRDFHYRGVRRAGWIDARKRTLTAGSRLARRGNRRCFVGYLAAGGPPSRSPNFFCRSSMISFMRASAPVCPI